MREAEFAARPGMTDEVLYARTGRCGRILLNRPRVINVLNNEMVTSILAQLEDWAHDDGVLAVSIEGACAPSSWQVRVRRCGSGLTSTR